MAEKEQQSKEDLRKAARRTASERRESLLHYELLNYAKPDSRSELARRSEEERRIKEVKEK